MDLLKRFLIGTAVLVALGCAATVAQQLQSKSQYTTVIVRNDNWALMRLYYGRNQSAPVRFGEVETGETRTFRLRFDPNVPYSFFVRPLAGESYPLGSISVTPGASVAIDIQNHIPLSSIFLR